MRKKITATYIALIVILTAAFSLIIMKSINEMVILQLEERFVSEAKIIGKLFEQSYDSRDSQSIESFAKMINSEINSRVTVIAKDGTVLADTSENHLVMSNHLNRIEVNKAIATNKLAISVRYSDTVRADFLYVAIPLEIEDEYFVLRVSKQLVEIETINEKIMSAAMISLFGAALIALMMSLFVSKKITAPIDVLTLAANEIAGGEFGRKIYLQSNDQIGELALAFNIMSQNLDASVNELKQRNSELEAILNSMINGIIAVDQDKNIIMINKFCFEILELPDDYVAENESMYKIIRNEEVANMVEQSMHNGESQVKELAYVHLDKVLRIYVNPIFDTNRSIIGSIVVIQDVTQIRKLEQMRSDFVSNVSHELKTPLTSIKGFVDTLKNGAINQPETARRFLDIIDIESDRLYRLISDILQLSEIESMDRETDRSLVDVQSVVEEVFDILEQKATEKGLVLESHFESRVVMKANRDRIKQMIINLVDNSIKFTEKGFIRIDGEMSADEIHLKITDTGIGFSESHKERLFERFYRVDKGRSRNQGGTGLGLSIVKHIVLLYKGRINVSSAPGKGTSFDIWISRDVDSAKK